MKFTLKLFCLLFLFNAYAVKNGAPAPDFELPSSINKKIKLSSYKGKTVILEWLNHGCPFVKKHYSAGNMQFIQQAAVNSGHVWLSIISSAPGKQGHSSPEQAEKDRNEHKSNASQILIDEDGKVGKLYGAKTTPHMYIIDPKGKLIYQGAIDDKPSTDPADIKGAKNFVLHALAAVKGGKKVKIDQTKAYGCSVKY